MKPLFLFPAYFYKMEYLITKGRALPMSEAEMESSEWFNMWSSKQFPYSELLEGDIIYWFDKGTNTVIWKTVVIVVERQPYSNKKDIKDKYGSMTKKYYDSRPEKGFFLYYKIKIVKRIRVSRPIGFEFPRLGWLRIDDNISKKWFNTAIANNEIVLDDIPIECNSSVNEILRNINKRMQHVSPHRVLKLVESTIRKDTAIIKALKKTNGFKCQFPNCGHKIKMKNGKYYIEVAHIAPVAEGGKSILGNLLVLCPNHHKEFDFGEREIFEQTETSVSGVLNGVRFDIGEHL
jgi:hypothetical protein